MRLLLIGCGNMGRSFLQPFIKSGIKDITVIAPEELNLECNIKHIKSSDISSVILDFDYIVLAVKPFNLDEVVATLSTLKQEKTSSGNVVILSMLAGILSETISQKFLFIKDGGAKIIRIMPNLPISIGRGVTMAFPSSAKNEIDFFLKYTGRIIYTDIEENINDFTALCGSGTGFAFYIMQAMLEAAQETLSTNFLNNPEELKKIVSDIFDGASALSSTSNQSTFEELKKSVTSKNGTTHAGLMELEYNSELKELFKKTLEATKNRSIEISKTETK